jgi:hypothetical protein
MQATLHTTSGKTLTADVDQTKNACEPIYLSTEVADIIEVSALTWKSNCSDGSCLECAPSGTSAATLRWQSSRKDWFSDRRFTARVQVWRMRQGIARELLGASYAFAHCVCQQNGTVTFTLPSEGGVLVNSEARLLVMSEVFPWIAGRPGPATCGEPSASADRGYTPSQPVTVCCAR